VSKAERFNFNDIFAEHTRKVTEEKQPATFFNSCINSLITMFLNVFVTKKVSSKYGVTATPFPFARLFYSHTNCQGEDLFKRACNPLADDYFVLTTN